jgi:hypothetical protein
MDVAVAPLEIDPHSGSPLKTSFSLDRPWMLFPATY